MFFEDRTSVYCVALFQDDKILLESREWESVPYLCLPADEIRGIENVEECVERIVSPFITLISSGGHPIVVGARSTHPITEKDLLWNGKKAMYHLVIFAPESLAQKTNMSGRWMTIKENDRPDDTFKCLMVCESFARMRHPVAA